VLLIAAFFLFVPFLFGSWPWPPAPNRDPSSVTSRCCGRATASARASVAFAAGARVEPLPSSVASPREGHGLGARLCATPGTRKPTRCGGARTYCSAHLIYFPFFSCVGSIHLLCALVFVHVRLPILDSTVLECLPELSCCACATILFLLVSLRLFFVSVDTLYEGFLFFSFTCVVYM